jgi:hypothetical protein
MMAASVGKVAARPGIETLQGLCPLAPPSDPTPSWTRTGGEGGTKRPELLKRLETK